MKNLSTHVVYSVVVGLTMRYLYLEFEVLIEICELNNYSLEVLLLNICLTSVTRAKLKEKSEICHSVSTRAVKCDGLFFILQHGFQYGFQHA